MFLYTGLAELFMLIRYIIMTTWISWQRVYSVNSYKMTNRATLT
jgi:hypothetical protein